MNDDDHFEFTLSPAFSGDNFCVPKTGTFLFNGKRYAVECGQYVRVKPDGSVWIDGAPAAPGGEENEG